MSNNMLEATVKPEDQREIVIDRARMVISEIKHEKNFEKACLLVDRAKSILEIANAINIFSEEDNNLLWE